MSDRVLIRCPNCRHELRVRSEYVGRTLECNYCHQTFLARQPDPAGGSGVTEPAQTAGTPRDEEPRRPPAALAAELEWARGKITRLRAQRQALARELLEAKNDLGPLQIRAADLGAQLEQARAEALHAQEESRSRELAQAELDRVRAEAATLGVRAAEADRLEDQLRHADERNRDLEAELLKAKARPSPADEHARSRESADRAAEVARLAEERDGAVRDRDRLQAELESIRSSFSAAREEIDRMGRGLEGTAAEGARLVEERETLARMRNEIQELAGARERSLAEREAELHEGRGQLDADRAELERRLGREQGRAAAELAEARGEAAALRLERDEAVRALEDLRSLDRVEMDRLRETASRQEQEIARLEAARASLAEERESVLRAREELEGERASLRDELDRRQAEDETKERGHREAVAELGRRHDEEREAWRGRIESILGEHEAAQRTIDDLRTERDRLAELHDQLQAKAGQGEQAQRDEIARLTGELAESRRQLDQKGRLVADLNRRARSPASPGRPELPPRPQAGPDDDPAALRSALETWLERAREELAATTARAESLAAEVKAALDELELLHRDLALGDWDEEEIAFPFEEG